MITKLAQKILGHCIEQVGPLSTPCMIWQGNKVGPGYGKIKKNGNEFMTHRIICEVTYGPIPPGCYAMHKCDTPSCCNPLHIKPGTPTDNALDSFAKGRRKYTGSSAKLTERQVREIRTLLSTQTRTAIANKYKVNPSTITMIKQGKTWANVK